MKKYSTNEKKKKGINYWPIRTSKVGSGLDERRDASLALHRGHSWCCFWDPEGNIEINELNGNKESIQVNKNE